LAKEDGTEVIMLTQPNLYKEEMSVEEHDILYMVNVETCGPEKQWSNKSAYRGMVAYNQKVREIAKQKNVHCIDLEKVIPKNATFFWDDVHYSDTTFSLIAEYLANEIMQQSLFNTLLLKKAGMNDVISSSQ